MKKTRKLISMLVALMACTLIACSGSSSSDDDDDASIPINAAFRDCTRVVSNVTLSDGNWTFMTTTDLGGYGGADSNVSLTASNGRYTCTSGSATITSVLDNTSAAIVNSMSQEDKDAWLREMASEYPGSQATVRGNKILITTPMTQAELREMQDEFDLNSFPPSVTIKANADNTKYVITNSEDRSTVIYLSKDINVR
ncbi:MAG: hypothetical protein J6Y30_05735 [Treponema sp.]|nr:hypothetical protein [Treponema sp.]